MGAEEVGLTRIVVRPAGLTHIPYHGGGVEGAVGKCLVAGDVAGVDVVAAVGGLVVVLETSTAFEKAPRERTESGAATVGKGEAGELVDSNLGEVAVLGVRRQGTDNEAWMCSAVDLECSNEDVITTTLDGILSAEVAAEVAELTTRHVHGNPDAHVVEVPEEGEGVLPSAEGEAGVAGDVLSKGTGVAVAIEVGGVFVADVGPPFVTTRRVFTNLEGELVDSVVSRGAAAVGTVEDTVAVVFVLVDVELGDTGGEEVEVSKGLVAKDVEAVSSLGSRHDGGAGRRAVHVAGETTELAPLGDNRALVEVVDDVASSGVGGEEAVVGEDDVEVSRTEDIEGEASDDATAADAREGVVAGEEVHGVGLEDGVVSTRVDEEGMFDEVAVTGVGGIVDGDLGVGG